MSLRPVGRKKMSKSSISRRSFVAASAVTAAAVGLSLSGCGGSSNTNTSNANTNSGAAKTGGTLTGGFSHKSTAYDPLGNSSALMLPASMHVFESLYGMDLSDYSTYNALAKAEPTKVSDTKYEVALRDGAKFSDGTAVTAKDVVASFEANMEDGQLYKAFIDFIDTVEAKDDATVTFNLKYPFDSLLVPRLATILIFPADSTADQRKVTPIGSGPWMYDAIDGNEGGKITFKPNPNYNGPKAPSAEAMEWDVLMDETARTTAMKEGTIMVMEDVPDANADDVKAAGATIDYLDSFCLAFLMFNCIKKPFDDYRVRQALFYAIDMDKLIKNQLNGHAKAPSGFLPESFKDYQKAETVYTYDVDKAKALLADAGVAEGTAVKFLVNGNWVKALAPQIQEDWKAIGLDVTMDVNTSPYDTMKGEVSVDAPYDFDVFLAPGDPSCFGNDPDLLMSWWFDSKTWLETRSCWGLASDGKSAELKALLADAREADAAQQKTIWKQCYDLLAEQVPLYPIFHKQMPTAYDETKIAGFKPISTTGLMFLDASCK